MPTDRLVDYFKGIYDILEGNGVRFVVYGHIAKGPLHTRPLLDLKDPADIARLQPLADAVFDLVNGLGGVISGEHGDGRLRGPCIARQYPAIVHLFQIVKQLLYAPRGSGPQGQCVAGADFRRRGRCHDL